MLSAFATALLIVAATSAGGATPSAQQSVLKAIFTAKTVDPQLFAASFTAQVPVSSVQSIVETFKAQLGELSSIEAAGSDEELVSKGSLLATVALDAQGKITGLLLHDEVDAANQAALERVLRADRVSADWFAPSFLAHVPAAQVDDVLAQIRLELGAFRRVTVRNGSYYSVFEKGESRTNVMIDTTGKINALLFRPPGA
jgi:hypothetical protein